VIVRRNVSKVPRLRNIEAEERAREIRLRAERKYGVAF
jgi:hypothetical protein